MKISPRLLCAFGAIAMLTGGCANDASTPNRSAASSQDRSDRIEIPPRDGMTKDEIVARYGRPGAVFVTDRGEVWRYLLNGGEMATKALIPFYPPVRPRFGTVIFGGDGRVREFHWQPDPQA